MLGAIIGDIVGSTREWHNIKTEDFELIPKGSRFTDDTVMTLAVAEWLMSDPEHRPETLVACMQNLGRKYLNAGYGGMFQKWLRSNNPQPYNSFGNGSAMRVSPVGLYANSLEEALELARITASVTHNHPEGIKGAQAIAGCVFLHKNISVRAEDEIRRFIAEKIGYDLDFNLEDIRYSYGFDVTCQGSVPIAIKAYLERSGYPPEQALRLAISMGGDSDTIGAMTASIASAERFNAVGGGFRTELIDQCRALLPADLLDINDRFEAFASRPLHQSYCLYGSPFAGEYPGDKDENVARQKIRHKVHFGVEHFVDPTEEGELKPYNHLLPKGTDHLRFPIPDCGVPKSIESVNRLPDKIKASEHSASCSNEARAARVKDCIRGSLMAGAAGDALGYTVEFMSRKSILARYGNKGITKFDLTPEGKALISDDTQMTLFTANGILMGITRGYMRGIGGAPENYVDGAYLDWYYTQTGKKKDVWNNYRPHTWICHLPELAHRRAPGNTCLSACESMLNRQEAENNSKGCGGIMRVAPMALLAAGYLVRGERFYSIAEMDRAGAETARVTHKHPLGFLPAAMLTHLLYKLVSMSAEDVRDEFEQLALETTDALDNIYKGEFEEDKCYLAYLTRKATALACNGRDDAENIRQLGEGWTGEEAWAIALYCALRHADSVEDAIIASVNHDGDSDSTGSVCGNIMGAIYGYEAIKNQRIFCPQGKELEQTLELSNIILALADDLYTSCIISEYDPIDTPEKRQWYERYCAMKPAGL